ncbi:MAG: hypothetical protein V6Z78_03775 [Holosporaceae bacterium]
MYALAASIPCKWIARDASHLRDDEEDMTVRDDGLGLSSRGAFKATRQSIVCISRCDALQVNCVLDDDPKAS